MKSIKLLTLALAIPMCLLYEVGIFFAQLVTRRKGESPVAEANPD